MKTGLKIHTQYIVLATGAVITLFIKEIFSNREFGTVLERVKNDFRLFSSFPAALRRAQSNFLLQVFSAQLLSCAGQTSVLFVL